MIYTQSSSKIPLNGKGRRTLKKLFGFKTRVVTVEFIPSKILNFTVFGFSRKFLSSYYTAMIYTKCYQCNPPKTAKKTQI